MSDRPKTNAISLEHDDGMSIVFIEGMRNRAEANSVARELVTHFNRAKKGGSFAAAIAVPPTCRLTIARGRRVDVGVTEDGRVKLEFKGRAAGESSILLPGRDFRT